MEGYVSITEVAYILGVISVFWIITLAGAYAKGRADSDAQRKPSPLLNNLIRKP